MSCFGNPACNNLKSKLIDFDQKLAIYQIYDDDDNDMQNTRFSSFSPLLGEMVKYWNFLWGRNAAIHSALIACAGKLSCCFTAVLMFTQVPVVAVMTTGGGTRALTSLLGNLLGLQKLDLLDAISYITGSSGSTW